jgi:hypothetical protein
MPDTSSFEPATAPFEPAAGPASHPSTYGGAWELELWSGSVRFSEWFYRRLPWAGEDGERTLHDLKPHLVRGAWDVLLQGIRGHLECGMRLDTEVCVQLEGGRIEWWRVRGAAERNSGGHPVHLAGSIDDVSECRR